MVFSAIQGITAKQWQKTASRPFWAAKQQTANTPRAPSSIWGRAAVPGSCTQPWCSCAEEQSALLGPSFPPKRRQQQPEQLGAQRTCKLMLGGRVFSHPQSLQQQLPRNALSAQAGVSGARSRLEKQGRKSRCANQTVRRHQGSFTSCASLLPEAPGAATPCVFQKRQEPRSSQFLGWRIR